MKKQLKNWILHVGAICGILLVAYVASLGNGPVYGGSVVVTISSDPGGLNPAITTQGGVHLICGSIFSGLVAHDFDLNPVPDLAERWQVSPDGRTYTFFLAQEAVFHDGIPVTSGWREAGLWPNWRGGPARAPPPSTGMRVDGTASNSIP